MPEPSRCSWRRSDLMVLIACALMAVLEVSILFALKSIVEAVMRL